MGIPSFYRWLVDRYPNSVANVVEDYPPAAVNGVSIPLDTSSPNPNELEFDNLYLDMNGIIHPCFHPEGLPAPETYDEVFVSVFKYIDKIFSIARPRKLLYMAIDGVAPRAKMNQQRTRRFRAAREAEDEASALTEVDEVQKLDSNVITPGTEFMALLSSALRYYINLRLNTDPGWRGIKVILSDANVPGEGEHKIMSYIRLQRNLPGFDPNTCHCLYGLDADLIMLALATHEIHFSILREILRPVKKKNQLGKKKKSGESDKKKRLARLEAYISRQKFQFLHIWVLRDYLAHEVKALEVDLERFIDDFVFMCLFVGNDFLPHVPSLEISEGAIDLLMTVYRQQFVHMGGYLTDSFEVNLKRVEQFVRIVGTYEGNIFKQRSQVKKERDRIEKERELRLQGSSTDEFVDNCLVVPCTDPPWDSQNSENDEPTAKGNHSSNSCKSNDAERPNDAEKPNDAEPVVDKIKLGEEGCKGRFYSVKFEVNSEDDRKKIRRHAVLKYVEGICWVMHYYYQGVCSWQWFYPYHYAPFASDFFDLSKFEIQFTLGEPFKPLDQLMGVLPAASAHALPLFYRKLMTDTSSPISDFYPNDFEIDMNGRRYIWQAVCKLPFIKESRLLSEIAKVEETLTDEEKLRNSLGLDVLCVHITHPLAVKIVSFCDRNKGHPKLHMAKVKRKINPKFSGGMNGYIYISDKPVRPVEIYSPIEDMEMIRKNEVVSVFYNYPPFHPHIPRPPEGVIMPPMSVSRLEVPPQPILWHTKSLQRIISSGYRGSMHKKKRVFGKPGNNRYRNGSSKPGNKSYRNGGIDNKSGRKRKRRN